MPSAYPEFTAPTIKNKSIMPSTLRILAQHLYDQLTLAFLSGSCYVLARVKFIWEQTLKYKNDR